MGQVRDISREVHSVMGQVRDEIVRDDFPIARRGYDPAAVRAHLEYVHERSSLSNTTANTVADIIEAAERTAAEIEQAARRETEQAQREAVEIREQASREAQRIIDTARTEGKQQTERAEGVLIRLVDEADRLRSALAKLGQEFTTEMQANGVPDMTPADAPAPEAPMSKRARFRLRRSDSRPLGPTGEAEPESDSAAEPDAPRSQLRFRPPDPRPLGPTGEAEPESDSAAEPDTPKTAEP